MSSLGNLVPEIELCPFLEKGMAAFAMFADVPKLFTSLM